MEPYVARSLKGSKSNVDVQLWHRLFQARPQHDMSYRLNFSKVVILGIYRGVCRVYGGGYREFRLWLIWVVSSIYGPIFGFCVSWSLKT